MRTSQQIRNIRIIGDENQCKIVMDRIRKDDMCAELPIVSIANKGKQNLTVKCANVQAADEIENLMKNKYRDNTQINKIVPTSPRVKITPLFTDVTDSAEVLNQLITQNQWLSSHQVEVYAFYGISSRNVQYKSLIIKCSDDLSQEFLARKRILFGM